MLKMKKFLRKHGRICLSALGIICVPCFFCLIFHGNDSSSFLFIHSSMGASEWFSFWITYFSTIVTGVLAYLTYMLTKSIERTHCEETAMQNKQLFEVNEINLITKNDKEFFIVKFNAPLILQDLEFKSAYLTIKNEHIPLQSVKPIFKWQYIELYAKSERTIDMWKKYAQNMQRDYKIADLCIVFSYEMQIVSKRTVWYVHSRCKAKVWQEDWTNSIHIMDTFVLTTQDKNNIEKL